MDNVDLEVVRTVCNVTVWDAYYVSLKYSLFLFIKTESTIKNKKPFTKNQIFSKAGKQVPFPYHKCRICGLPITASD